MSDQNVAFRYAKSLIGLAQEKGVLDIVSADMQFFRSICDQNRDFVLALKSPIVRHTQKLAILKALFEKQVSPITFSIFKIITEKNREAILPSVATEFERQYRTIKGILVAHVTTASPLTEAQKTEISALVGKQLNSQVVLEEKIEPQLIGGYVLRVGDTQVDNSIKSRLNDLKVKFAS